MKLLVKSNGNPVEMKKEIFDNLPEDQKRSYEIIDPTDSKATKEKTTDQPVTNEAPSTGQKK